jgi:hypothetical protein
VTVPAGSGGPLASVSAAVGLPLQVGLGELAFLLLFFALALFLIYQGFDEYRASRLIQDTATEKVRSVAAGRTELTGTADPDETVFHRPFTDGECVYAHYRIREHHESGSDGSDWRTVDSDTWIAPFFLDDGTGRIRVEPERSTTFEISDEHSTTVTVEEDHSPPPDVREFLEEVSSAGPADDKRRYVEEVIPPGEEVYVLGGAEQRDDESGDNEDRLVVRRDGGSDRFIVSDMSEEELASTLTYRVPLLIVFGLAISTGCLYVLLRMFGLG